MSIGVGYTNNVNIDIIIIIQIKQIDHGHLWKQIGLLVIYLYEPKYNIEYLLFLKPHSFT